MPTSALRTALDLMYYSGASALCRPFVGGIGAIFMLHHVRPGGGVRRGFSPNYGLEMSPEFLDQVIALAKRRGYDLVSIEEAVDRLEGVGKSSRPFAVFTLDDGYRDNLEHALPVFRRHQCPFTVFVAPAITDGTCELWWRGLEAVIGGSNRVVCEIDGKNHDLPTATDEEKWRAWATLYGPVRNTDQYDQRRWIRDICSRNGVDLAALCRDAAMSWDELRTIAADPLCTIGAHTVHHFALRRLTADQARDELAQSADRIQEELGRRPRYFAYPYGDKRSAGPRDFRLAREAGFRAAVTTRKGLIFPEHAAHLTALPRASLSGKIQELRYVDMLMQGLPFALFNRFRKVNVS
jgi:peptidoglycan/xylan/chitin deacetylase (PgdA/CDA1 family)